MVTTTFTCQVPKQCLSGVNSTPDQPCNPEDLGCICERSQSLEHNSLFDAHCLFKECTDEVGRGEFLRDLIVTCERKERQLIDIPAEWQPYLPFPAMTTQGPAAYAPTSATAALGVTSSTMYLLTMSTLLTSTFDQPPSTVSAPPPPAQTITKTTTKSLSPGIIAAICISVIIPLLILIILAYLYWKSRKIAKAKLAENARLRDECSREGFSQRIRELLEEAVPPMREVTISPLTSAGYRSSSVYSREQQLFVGGGREGQ